MKVPETEKVEVKERRCELRMPQTYVAFKTGIAQPTLSLIENGFIKPSQEVLERLGEVLGIPGDQLKVPSEPKTRWDL